jgi:hypothetical protein
MPSRQSIDRALVVLVVLVVTSSVVRFSLSRGVAAPWIAPDEHVYGLVGRSLVGGDGLAILGERVPYYSLLYPLFVGIPFLATDVADGVTAVQALQALVMSATAVPVFLWTRPLAGSRAALLAATLTVLMPGLAYSGLLMSEAVYYLAAVVAAWSLAACLRDPSIARQAVLLGAVGVALATRLQAIGFVGAIVLALLVLAAAERSTHPFRRMLPTLAALGVAGSVWVATRLAAGGVGESLGAYAPLSAADEYSLVDISSSVAWQAGAVVLLTIGIPLVALGILGWETVRGREQDVGVRALVATTVAYLVVTVVEVGAFASRFVEHITERQLLSVAPPVFIVFAVWLRRGIPRPQPATSVIAIAIAASALLLPIERITTRAAAADSLSTIPLEQLRRHVSEPTFEAGYAAIAALVLLLAVFVPRRAAPILAGIVACSLAACSVVASREIRDRSRADRESTFAGASVGWLDESRAGDVTLFVTGDRLWPSTWHHLFWNTSIANVVRLRGAESPGVAPQQVVSPRPDGTLVDAAGDPIDASRLAVPSTVTPAGELITSLPPSGEQPGMALWLLDRPARLLQRITGLRPNGDVHGGDQARIDVFGCGPGELQLTILGKQGLATRIRSQGRTLAERAVPPGEIWRPAVPAPSDADGSGRCVYVLETDGLVGSTRVEFVRG